MAPGPGTGDRRPFPWRPQVLKRHGSTVGLPECEEPSSGCAETSPWTRHTRTPHKTAQRRGVGPLGSGCRAGGVASLPLGRGTPVPRSGPA